MEENLRAALAAFSRAKPGGETRTWPGMSAARAAVNFAMFNAVTLTAPVETCTGLEACIEEAAAYFAESRLPWSFWLCDAWLGKGVPGRVQQAFNRNGLHLVLELPGMEALALAPPCRPIPNLAFRRVQDGETRSAFTYIMSSVFGIPYGVAREIYGAPGFWDGQFSGWLAYEEDVPVASAATVAAGGVIGVYGVGSLPQRRRLGYGEAVMRHAIEREAEASGGRPSALQSSEAGLRLYERMGFRPVARYAIFASG